jgi:hypothetical protein
MTNSLSVGPSEAWAEVRAHDHVMRYRRSGTGHAVLVLRGPHEADVIGPDLADGLADRFRVFVPDLPVCAPYAAEWISNFLEGLGLVRVALVAGEPYCMPALELAWNEPARVSRLVLITDADDEEDGESSRLLIVRPELPSGDATELIGGFLAGSAASRVG